MQSVDSLGRISPLDRRLIAAKGGSAGTGYRLLDRGHRGTGYRLEAVDLDGTRHSYPVH